MADDPTAALAQLIQADPQLNADMQKVFLETQVNQLRNQGEARIGIIEALAKRQAAARKEQQAMAGKQGPPGQAQSETVRGIMRGPGAEFPKIDTAGNSLNQGRSDLSGTGVENAVMGGAFAQKAGPAQSGPGGPAQAVGGAMGRPPAPQAPPTPGGMPSVNIGGQQFSAPNEIVTTQETRGSRPLPTRSGYAMLPYSDTTTTTEPNVLRAGELAQLAQYRQATIMQSAMDVSRETGAPLGVAGQAMTALMDGDTETATRITAPYPNLGAKLYEAQIRAQDSESRYRNALADAQEFANDLNSKYREMTLRLGFQPDQAGDYAQIAGIGGLAPRAGEGGMGGGGMFEVGPQGTITIGGGGGKGAMTAAQANKAREQNRNNLFAFDSRTGEVTGVKDFALPLELETGYALRDDQQLPYIDDGYVNYVNLETLQQGVAALQDPKTPIDQKEAILEAFDAFPFMTIDETTLPSGELVLDVRGFDPLVELTGLESQHRPAAKAFSRILAYWEGAGVLGMPPLETAPAVEPPPEPAPVNYEVPGWFPGDVNNPRTGKFTQEMYNEFRRSLTPEGVGESLSTGLSVLGGGSAATSAVSGIARAARGSGRAAGLARRLGPNQAKVKELRDALAAAQKGRSVPSPLGPGGPPVPRAAPMAQRPTSRPTASGFSGARPPKTPTPSHLPGTPGYQALQAEAQAAAAARAAQRTSALEKARQSKAAKKLADALAKKP